MLYGLFMMREVNTRGENVLRLIVQSYIKTAKPVGSSHLVKRYRLKCSPATVRNEMANLESCGYIKQPHTSAGRVPTDRGYRCFINELMKAEPLTSEEKRKIIEEIEKAGGNVNRILEEASAILGRVSHELGVVLTPWMSWGIFDRLELVELTGRKILVVIHVRSRSVKTVILEVESELKRDDLRKATNILNERLSGLTLEEIRSTINQRIGDVYAVNIQLLRRLVNSASILFDFSEPTEVHTFGTQNILAQPEFSDATLLEQIFTLIGNKRHIIHLFHKKVKGTEVIIGQENENKRLSPFTVIVSSYRRGEDVGTLGVIGPTRMQYTRILPFMDFMSSTMSHYLS